MEICTPVELILEIQIQMFYIATQQSHIIPPHSLVTIIFYFFVKNALDVIRIFAKEVTDKVLELGKYINAANKS